MRTKQNVKAAAIAVAATQSLIIPAQARRQRLTSHPPRNVPPPPAGTVITPGILGFLALKVWILGLVNVVELG